MNDHNPVQDIFNKKARSWSKKYERGGSLTSRIQYFFDLLSQSTRPPAKILDIGCGTGNLSVHLSQHGYQVIGCDIAEEMLTLAKQINSNPNVQWLLLPPNWQVLPFNNEVFDSIISSSTFEYLERVEPVLAECARVLKSNGTLVITVPNPQSPIRRKEKRLRRLIRFPLFRCLEWIPKVRQYFTYLRISRNRFSHEEWRNFGFKAGLILLDGYSQEVKAASGEATLLLLCFKKD